MLTFKKVATRPTKRNMQNAKEQLRISSYIEKNSKKTIEFDPKTHMFFCSSLPYFVPRPKNSDEGLEFSLSFIFKNYCCVCPQFIGFEKQYNHANIYVVSLGVSDWTLPKG